VSVVSSDRAKDAMSTGSIELYAGKHAIETEQFVVTFRSPLDTSDEGRFSDQIAELQSQFAAITEPEVFQFVIGETKPSKPVLKRLNEFGRDGRPTWDGQFGENAVLVASRQYTGWLDIWPKVKAKLELLLGCVDPFKIIASIDYSVTDTFLEKSAGVTDAALRSNKMFKPDSWVPYQLLDNTDPRWDFDAGRFVSDSKEAETLERIKAKGVIAGDSVQVSITNSFSYRFRGSNRLSEFFRDGETDSKLDDVFDRFHDANKVTIKSILIDDLLTRMGLK